MKLIEKLECIERVDGLIRRKSTGRPRELANRLSISESGLYELLNTMKSMGAPIYYCTRRGSYCYQNRTYFTYGFKRIE